MGVTLFLSHDHRDKALAEVLARTLARVSLGQIQVWFSSDGSPAGGIAPGGLWLDEIRSRLISSPSLLVLLTPLSLSRPGWLLFESGLAAASPDCQVVPLCVGVSTDSVPFPLGLFQGYQLADYESFKGFTAKLLARHGVSFDEEMTAPVLRKAVGDLTQVLQAAGGGAEPGARLTLTQLGEVIKEHIDRRFFELAGAREPGGPPGGDGTASYTVTFDLDFPRLKQTQYLEVDRKDSVADVLTKLFYLLSSVVEPHTYLQHWILSEVRTGRRLVLREVSGRVPARAVFRSGSKWLAAPLELPYSGFDSAGMSEYENRE